jgi:hypothetical protein
MPTKGSIAIKCLIARSGIPSERVFRIKLFDGETYVGVAARDYCYDLDGRLIKEDQPPPGKRVEGLISARLVREEGDGSLMASIPDGAVVVVSSDQTKSHPAEVSPNVSL